MNQSENINELASALAKCQGELTPAQKNSKNPFFKSVYADLTDCLACCKEPLAKNGLAVIQTMQYNETGPTLMHTTLTHSSGQWIRSTMPLICKNPNDIQSMGSSITYCRRYSLCSIVGISAGDDDDGNGSIAKESSSPPVVYRAFAQENPQTPPIAKTAADLIATPQMISDLKSLINQDPTYLTRVNDFIIKEKKVTWETLPMSTYNGLMESAKKHFNVKDGQ